MTLKDALEEVDRVADNLARIQQACERLTRRLRVAAVVIIKNVNK